MNILVTGGAGFIGSALVRHLVAATEHHVTVVDKLTYAGSLEALRAVADHPRYAFTRIDIGDAGALQALFSRSRPDAVVHLAAETHVDRSIGGPMVFVDTNVVGTAVLLDVSRHYWQALDADARARFRFLHLSTDEVFGSLGPRGRFSEESPYNPSSPYSASKAGSDHLARAWCRTFGLPVIVVHPCNNFGPFQFPEKFVPTLIINALRGEPLPIYGAGDQVRDWLWVGDHVEALLTVLAHGRPGESYTIGAGIERRNRDLAEQVCAILDEMRPRGPNRFHRQLIRFVADRPGHDTRYAIDPGKMARELGWRARHDFDDALRRTVAWYCDHRSWWEARRGGASADHEQGIAAGAP